jgi:hypothetical protein
MTMLLQRLVFVLFLAEVGFGGEVKPLHVPNFAEVNDHLCRGGVPSNIGLKELSAMHVSWLSICENLVRGQILKNGPPKCLG